MKKEIIKKIVLNNDNELVIYLDSEGETIYQYIYREAAGVYWDEKVKGFKSTSIKEWSISEWYFHIVNVTRNINIELNLSDKTIWENIPNNEQNKIKEAVHNTFC